MPRNVLASIRASSLCLRALLNINHRCSPKYLVSNYLLPTILFENFPFFYADWKRCLRSLWYIRHYFKHPTSTNLIKTV